MIPELIKIEGTPYAVLPPGVHRATLDEVAAVFATNNQRKALFKGIVAVAKALGKAGCAVMYLDGSYVTSKKIPSDFDGCWDPRGVDGSKIDPVLLDFTNERKAQKEKYGGEMFIASFPATAAADKAFLDFFQTEKHTGEEKGIIAIELGDQK